MSEVAGYGLYDWGSILGRGRAFCLRHGVQTGFFFPLALGQS
jgi:hypothetical protein